ncbi:sigma-54 dependent transcriptional regulator [Desulfosarcina sp.]|uniref:sigma-54-dependent transcriptional regulator n=1 Tax=Desulfosarcina sp. TaxID=2027861 RepID=UPI0029A9BE47|nr:sigma-54 dependent transcriptional regulator [Desulfosarcina sp.]MDX2451961.1 sigma-54 dependent transcriptional regulator [Desulfosarcina sp.]MDX2489745.1 sigma-54 dependent transcriptional regulator [Desulfosarcina sp.]
MAQNLLIVDDEPDMLTLLKRSLEPELDCQVDTASSGEAALEMLRATDYDLVLADIKMPGISGLEVLERVKADRGEEVTVVMMTAYGHIEMAVEAMKRGAYDFVTKPFDHDALVMRLEKAFERSRLLKENLRLQHECHATEMFQELVGKSPKMQRVYETIQMVAKNELTVLITGESGTGKDLVARAVHALSNRSKRPFIAVNCPTVPELILESELFGYKKGAFTHATRDKKGLFQEAHSGTIFLDEIGDITPTIQTKLLRVLQEKEIKSLGDARPIHVDVRIIASTNQPLAEKIKSGDFREDFFYRLNVLPIKLPPLRERPEDIPLIANHLLEKHCTKLDKPLKRFSTELMDIFIGRRWEGNVRQMENMIMQGILFSAAEEIKPTDVGITRKPANGAIAEMSPSLDLPYKAAKENNLSAFNAAYIGHMLTLSQGNVTQAAKACGLERQALQQIMRRYGITADPYRQ